MKLTNDKLMQIKDRLNKASSPEEMLSVAKELGYDLSAEEAAALFSKVQTTEVKDKMSIDEMDEVAGGFGTDSIPQYGIIKDYYKEKGSNLAFTLCVYFIPSPLCYEVIECIEDDIRSEK